MERVKRIAWVERLTLADIIIFLVRSVFRPVEVRYNEHLVPRHIEALLGRIGKAGWPGRFLPAGLLLNLTDENGRAIEYQRADDLSGAIDSFCESKVAGEPDWFKKMLGSYLSSFLDQRVTFVTMVKRRIHDLASCTHEIYPANHFANYILRRHYKRQGLRIRQHLSLTSFARMALKPPYLLGKALLAGRSKKVFGTVERHVEKNSLWIEHEPLHGLWNDFRRFIIARGAAHTIVYYFDRTDTPVTTEATQALENMGLKWIDLHGFRNGRLTARDAAGVLWDALKAARVTDPLWLGFFRLNFGVTRKLYANLFKDFNVKALIQHQEVSWMQEAQAQAVAQAGGIMLGLHWSSYLNYVYPTHITPQHVFFVWGGAHYDLLEKKGNTIDHILPSGLWIKEGPEAPPPLTFSEGVDFTISVFDDNAGYDLCTSPDTMSRFYMSIVEVLEADSRIGALIKSKAYDIEDLVSFSMGSDMVRRMKALIGQKRMIFLDYRHCSPIVAAKHSDLAVCCGINSAGIIAGLHGCRVVCWDCTGWLKYPMYRDSEQKVVYTSIDDMKKAIELCAKGDATVGDLSRWRRRINYYDDAEGKERICDFIEMFMESIGSGHDRETSLRYAVDSFCSKNKVSETFFRSHDWWN